MKIQAEFREFYHADKSLFMLFKSIKIASLLEHIDLVFYLYKECLYNQLYIFSID